DVSPVPVFGSLRDAAPKEILIKALPSPRETPRNNLRFRIVNGAPDQMIFTVLERNRIAIRRISENLEHFAGKHPVVPMQNSRTRFDNNSGHRSSTSNAQLLCHSERSRERSGWGSRDIDGKAED